jgi:hypothetical protein
MQINYLYHLIQTVTPPVWGTDDDSYRPANFQPVGGGVYSQAAQPDDAPPEVLSQPEMAGATLIGTWDRYGASVGHDEAAYLALRPLGNEGPRLDEEGQGVFRAGKATGPLRYANFGAAQRKLSAGDGEMAYYPESVSPVEIKAGHHWVTEGGGRWVLRCEVVGEHRRDVSVRQIDVYTDEECKQFDYKIPAFTPQKSEWQVGDDGEPLDVWVCQAPVARWTAEKQALHFALVLDNAQEGFFTLGEDDATIDRLFWDVNQADDPVVVQSPRQSWTKARMIDYILEQGLGRNLDRQELESMSKARVWDIID